jgi:hypothetical protein
MCPKPRLCSFGATPDLAFALLNLGRRSNNYPRQSHSYPLAISPYSEADKVLPGRRASFQNGLCIHNPHQAANRFQHGPVKGSNTVNNQPWPSLGRTHVRVTHAEVL